jgi:hypothetical protein
MISLLPTVLKTTIYSMMMRAKFLMNNIIKLFYSNKYSYSEYNEDILVENLFSFETGSYVDIGAGHPTIGSNTYYFYKKGWNGITVEPIRFHYFLHKFKRRRDIQFNTLIGEDKQKTTFYEFNPTQYSTMSKIQYQKLIEQGMKERKSYLLNSLSINEVLTKNFHSRYFLSIDCEGYDFEIISAINWDKIVKPKVILYENLSDLVRANHIAALLENQQYILKYVTPRNSIYLLNTEQ